MPSIFESDVEECAVGLLKNQGFASFKIDAERKKSKQWKSWSKKYDSEKF